MGTATLTIAPRQLTRRELEKIKQHFKNFPDMPYPLPVTLNGKDTGNTIALSLADILRAVVIVDEED